MSAVLPKSLASAAPGHQEADDAFQLLVEQVADYAIFLLDLQGRVSSWNIGAQRITGFAPQEVLGRPFAMFFSEEDQGHDKPARILEAASRDGRHEDEGWRVRKDGSRYWAHGLLTALHDHAGRPHGFAKITRDLTERLNAEAAARGLAEERAARAQRERADEERRLLLRRQNELSSLRADVSSAALSETGSLPDHAVRAVVQRLGVAAARLWLFDDEGTLRLSAHAGRDLPGHPEQLQASIVGRIAATGAPASSGDLSADPGFGPASAPIAFAGCPLLAVGRVQGVLGAFGRGALPDDTLDALRGVADVLAHSLERQRAEVELRRSRDRLAVILSTITDGVTAQAQDGRLVFANEAAARVTGFDSAAQMLSTPVRDIVGRFEIRDENGDLVRPGNLPGRQALEAGRASHLTVRLVNLGTKVDRWVQVSAAPVLGERGEVELAVNVFTDLTERKRMEEAWRFLAEASAVLGSSLGYESTLAAVARLSVPQLADWCAVDVLSPEGQLETQVVAHADPSREVLEPEERPADPRVLLVVATGEAQLGPGSTMIVPLVVGDRPFGAMTFVAAETRRGYDRQDLILAQEIARRAALAMDNARAYHEVRAAVQMRDTFLSIASHELKTPMSSLTLLLSGLLRSARAGKLDELSGDKIIARLERVEEQADRLTALMNQLLDVSRLAAGRFALAPTDTDLVAVAREVLTRFQEEAGQAGATLELVAEGPVVGRWDRGRLDQVLTNLITNALKYGASSPITVEVAGGPDTARLSVVDRGPGIAEADQTRIFDQYERAASTNLGGLGLGLWLVRELVRAHGGEVAVRSRPGEGAAFTVILPRRVGPG
jgi:PAS domain S-box-containing protein